MPPRECDSRFLSTSTTNEAFPKRGSTLLASPLYWFQIAAVTLRRSFIRITLGGENINPFRL